MPDLNVTGIFVFCNVFCILKLVSQELRSKFDILVRVNSVAHRFLFDDLQQVKLEVRVGLFPVWHQVLREIFMLQDPTPEVVSMIIALC